MTEFYKGSIPCVVGQTTYNVVHPKINDPLSFPLVSMVVPNLAATPVAIKGIANKTTVSFDVVLASAPAVSGYAINWQVNIPGTDVAEYVNDKRYFSKEEIGNAKLARVHWKNVIAAPDMTAEGLQNNHNHNNLYFTKSQIVPVIDSRITDAGSYNPYAKTLMLRDASGRSQVNSPKVSADVSNKGYTDTLVAGEVSARIAGDMNLQSQVTEISGSYATDVDTANLQAQITTLETLIMAISGTGFYSGGSVPVGTIISQASSASLGMDWGYCDGGAMSVSADPELFARIGFTFGGSGDTYFKPDLRGDFQRGWDDGRGVDAGRIFGSFQIDDNKVHSHGTSVNTAGAHNHTVAISADGAHSHTTEVSNSGDHVHSLGAPLLDDAGTSIQGQNSPNDADPINQTEAAGDHGHAVTVNVSGEHSHATTVDTAGGHDHSVTVNSTGSESRPRNVALKFFIKLYTPPMLEPVDVATSQSISGQKTFLTALIVPELPQAIIFGDPLVSGTKALGMIGGQMAVTMHVSAGIWTPIAWLT